MKILAVIPARANSRRLKKKNLKKINNKSLTEITIEFVLKLKKIFDIIVTSDSNRINELAKTKKVKFVEKRPPGLSMNNTSSAMTVIHGVKWYEEKFQNIDAIALFQPTTTFRELKFINKCIDRFILKKRPVISSSILGKKKNLYLSDGSIYLILKKDLFRLKSFNEKIATKVYSFNPRYSIDIDNISDFEKAKRLSNIYKK